MLIGVQQDRAGVLQQVRKGLVATEAVADRQEMSAIADQPFTASERAPGIRNPDHNLFLPRQPMQQCGIGGKKGHKEGATLLAAQLLERASAISR